MNLTVPPDRVPTRKHRRKRPETRPAYVSLLWPADRRQQYHYLARCPVCGAPHLGRAPELADVTRDRRLPCGHWAAVVVARTYGRPEVAR